MSERQVYEKKKAKYLVEGDQIMVVVEIKAVINAGDEVVIMIPFLSKTVRSNMEVLVAEKP